MTDQDICVGATRVCVREWLLGPHCSRQEMSPHLAHAIVRWSYGLDEQVLDTVVFTNLVLDWADEDMYPVCQRRKANAKMREALG